MFNLEQSILEWRRQMLVAGVKTTTVLDELENHLREDVERHAQSGLSTEQALQLAMQRIGQADALRLEFSKLGVKTWNRPLASTAWVVFFISFLLPSYCNLAGWKCALLQPYFWSGALHGEWPSINYELLTLANLLMLASPLLLFRFGGNSRSMKCLRYLIFTASFLVWFFIGALLTHNEQTDLRLGCYVWGLSFVLLQLSALRRPVQQKRYAAI